MNMTRFADADDDGYRKVGGEIRKLVVELQDRALTPKVQLPLKLAIDNGKKGHILLTTSHN